jgi:RimJ/RimL family protein N-acetyltransferase
MDLLTWPEAQPDLADDSVRLRPFLPDDAAWVHEACQDPDIQRWTRVPVPYARHHAEEFIGHVAPSEWHACSGCHTAIEDLAYGSAVGACGLEVLDAVSGVVAAGYWVAPAHRGRGLATRALRLLSAWGFSHLGVARIELHVDSGNAASVEVGRRSGFEVEGVLRQKIWRLGEQRDMVMLARVHEGPGT